MMTADTSHLSATWKTPRDSFRELAERTRRSPEAVAIGESVGQALDAYLAGALTLRELARRHTPYERFRAVRVWGPDDPRFQAIMPVLDDLIALHQNGRSAAPTPGERLPYGLPIAAKSGRGFTCAICGGTTFAIEGQPLVCRSCRQGRAASAD